MTYRERRLAKAERLRKWAADREEKAAATLKANEQYRGDYAFNTQPGHIPERARVIAREDRAYASLGKARSMKSRAGGIEAAADAAIYSDDPDAIESLEARIAELDARQERMKEINVAIKKGVSLNDLSLTERERDDLVSAARYSGVKGYPAYALSNNRGNLRRNQQRLAQLRGEQSPPAPTSEAGQLLAYEQEVRT